MDRNEFTLLVSLIEPHVPEPARLLDKQGLSISELATISANLQAKGLLNENGCLTEKGLGALDPYRVRNAVIMAAGISSRFAPISYEKPKGTLKVRGEVLIERQIIQLREAGINDITVVVGYKKEEFFYLEDTFGVKIVVNDEYMTRNNHSTIKKVAKTLGRTYICSSDNYFSLNPFERYVYDSYYSSIYHEGPTNEYCLETDGPDDIITGVHAGGSDAWIMLGHAYWNDEFAAAFCNLLDAAYNNPGIANKLWEDLYAEHVGELPMRIRRYEANQIWEFDSLDELHDFDPCFIENVDSSALDNICSILHCKRADISHFEPIKQGLTNLSVRFEVNGDAYVYRHPGPGTNRIINRKSEAHSQKIARNLEIDRTFIHEDPETGWKISRFVEGCIPFDYRNESHVRSAMKLLRTLHESGASSPWAFDVFEKAEDIIQLLGPISFKGFGLLHEIASSLSESVKANGVVPVLCHNDFYSPNLLIHGGGMDLIDWEYSAMSDYASDLGTFICCSDYDLAEAESVVWEYFQREPTPDEMRHCIAYVSLCAFYWFVWALYMDRTGSPVGEWLYIWYRMANVAGGRAKTLYAI